MCMPMPTERQFVRIYDQDEIKRLDVVETFLKVDRHMTNYECWTGLKYNDKTVCIVFGSVTGYFSDDEYMTSMFVRNNFGKGFALGTLSSFLKDYIIPLPGFPRTWFSCGIEECLIDVLVFKGMSKVVSALGNNLVIATLDRDITTLLNTAQKVGLKRQELDSDDDDDDDEDKED